MSEANRYLGSITEFASRHGYTALKFYLLSIAREIDADPRLRICYRYKLPDRETVDLVMYHDQETGKHTPGIRGTMKCSRFWQCPVCASRIGNQRRAEMSAAIDANRDLVRIMITYTCSHNRSMPLRETLDSLLAVYRKTRSGRWWQGLKEEFSLLGSVRATEITHGLNGWHPHFHEILFVDGDPIHKGWISIEEMIESLQTLLARRWREMLHKEKLDATLDRGLVVSDRARDMAGYINKFGRMPREGDQWGDSSEITLQTSKIASGASRTPFEILFDARSDPGARGLWIEYVMATKGKAALIWSRGTKTLLGIDEIRDADIDDPADIAEALILQRFTSEQWTILARYNMIPALLSAAQSQRLDHVLEVVSEVDRLLSLSEFNKCPKHGIGLEPGSECPICKWENSEVGKNA